LSLDAFIIYKDPSRADWTHPFCFQSVLRDYWWPLAVEHGLELLQRLETLSVDDREEAEQLIRECRAAEKLLREPGHAGVPEGTEGYMLERLDIVVRAFEGALAEWQDVKQLVI
jgi:hypothetical protein